MINENTRFKIRPDIVHTRLNENETALLNLATKQYFSLNQTGQAIWDLLLKNKNPAEIAQALASSYDVDRQEALKYTMEFVQELSEEGIL